MDTKTLMIIYCAFFHSLINYGVIAWDGACDNNMKLIQSIQNKILKIINKNKFPQTNPPLIPNKKIIPVTININLLYNIKK